MLIPVAKPAHISEMKIINESDCLPLHPFISEAFSLSGTGKECIVSKPHETINNALWTVLHLKAFLRSCLLLNGKAQECFVGENLSLEQMFPA